MIYVIAFEQRECVGTEHSLVMQSERGVNEATSIIAALKFYFDVCGMKVEMTKDAMRFALCRIYGFKNVYSTYKKRLEGLLEGETIDLSVMQIDARTYETQRKYRVESAIKFLSQKDLIRDLLPKKDQLAELNMLIRQYGV